METTQVDYTNKDQVIKFIEANSRNVTPFVKEYRGDRKIRKLQVGYRENYQNNLKTIEAERLVINLQRKIVETAASFLLAEPVSISANDPENENGQRILKTLKKNRINNKLLEFAKVVMSETMAVFIFSEAGTDKEIKARMYTSDNGKYTPEYDVYGDLVAFYWEFVIDEVSHLWIFTDEYIHKYSGPGSSDLKYLGSDTHSFGVIPVVFNEQPEPEWYDVKEMIDRIEMILSKLAGSNNYFAFPILKLKGSTVKNKDGKEEGLIDISDDGKSILLGVAEKNGQIVEADADFLQRDTGVQSIELEMKFLKEFIFNISQTPDLSFDNVKGIGTISGRALELMLQDAINKAKSKQGQYRTVIERIINVVKNGMGIKDEELEFDIDFNLSIPRDIAEEIKALVDANGGYPVMSQESSVSKSPYTKDVKTEIDQIQKETAQRSSRSLVLEDE
ncbi:phage portal protein [Leeuwenhoekiella marinoflava]|uniref:SPP1 family phage portal protein n=2 Tax=Leeuwenhoekiella marinoflava TaxID=988 RepID=A0A4Q0PMQ7_9FLAO|nr:phage portal protein [Leeuwenhoekiella marinoflava]RXG31799.1 SPP1 family phage portal protein [Leeuwenhoekiella marinoflava]SHF04753.1 phage portal protein, SPP1 family [Leeuwenhoekiella marinoflava DSM 3653]